MNETTGGNGRVERGRFEGAVLARLAGIENNMDRADRNSSKTWSAVRELQNQVRDLSWKQKGISAAIALAVSVLAWAGQLLIPHLIKLIG